MKAVRSRCVILVFKDRNAFKPFMPVANGGVVPVGGFFQPGEDVNYITLTLETANQGFPVVFHEFAHLLLRGIFADAPLWFNEGLAEYYSTFEVSSSRRANIGKPDENHLRLLQSRSLPFARFFAIDRTSPSTRRTRSVEICSTPSHGPSSTMPFTAIPSAAIN